MEQSASRAPRTLYLIDGYAQFFRAYHAIRTPMSSPVTKEPTNMTFGFIGMLLKLLRGEGKIVADAGQADFIAVALDVSDDRGTFRSELYPEYKATRPPAPVDLKPQVERCLRMLESLGVPTVGAAGFEADDAIATVVARLRETHPELRIRIISKDKDLKQLLEDRHVELYDIHHDEVIDQSGLKAELGLEPAQIVDYLALMGDNVDNVPGVEGVGPKTAAQLIGEYGSLDGVLEESRKGASKIKGKRLEHIRAADATGQMPLSRTLVTLRRDAPVKLDLERASKGAFRLQALMPILKELGFNRYQDELKLLTGETLGPMAGSGSVESTAGQAGQGGVSVANTPAKHASQGATGRAKTQKASDQGTGSLFGGSLFNGAESGPAGSSGEAGSLMARLTPAAGEYRCVRTREELRELVEELRGAAIIAVDTETTGLAPLRDELCGVSLSTRVGTGVYVPVRSPAAGEHLGADEVIAALKPILEDPRKAKCGHNLKFDALVLRKAGLKLGGFFANGTGEGWKGEDEAGLGHGVSGELPRSTVFDSMIASYLIDSSRSGHGLDALALALLGRTNISLRDLIGSGANQKTFDKVPLELATPYAAEDADVALQLYEAMRGQLVEKGLMPLFERVEMPLVEVLSELEWNGIKVDKAELERQRSRLQTRIDELKDQIDRVAMESVGRTFNPESPKQLSGVLFNKADHASEPGLGLKPIKRTQTGYSTDAEVLETLAEDPAISTPIPKLIVEHRELCKLVGTYLVSLADGVYPGGVLGGGRVHSSFHQTGAATGRLSSSDPNLQNIPIRTDVGREIRRAFIAEQGHALITADYSQIELRLLAHLSRDPALIEAFHLGQDIHTAVAAQINGVALDQVTKQQRSGAKMVNFGIVYGITAFGLARRLGISNSAADEIISGYKKRFAGITTFLQECVDQAQRNGYVETMLRRRRPIPEIDSNIPSRRAFAERTAINSVVQGSAADLIKLAMVQVQQDIACGLMGGTRMLLQIHDELVLECPLAEAEATREMVVRRMEGAMVLSVPLKADASIASNWFDGK